MPFGVLFVCTGNVCRSPTAERLLRHRLAERLPASAAQEFRISSAGLVDLAGAAMEPSAAAALSHLGGDPAGHRSRALGRAEVEDSDLALGMTREHRAAAVALCPPAAPRTFTLRQFARLCEAVDPAAVPGPREPGAARAGAILTAAVAQRGLTPLVPPEQDDLADPLGGPAEQFAATAAYVDAALRPFVDLLVGVRPVGAQAGDAW